VKTLAGVPTVCMCVENNVITQIIFRLS
jgi:hypothetical protein